MFQCVKFFWTVLFLGTASIYDARSHRIPNYVIGMGYGFSLLSSIVFKGVSVLPQFLLEAGCPYLFSFLFFLGLVGAGDIKCVSVLFSMIGLKQGFIVFKVTILLMALFLVGRRIIVSRDERREVSGLPLAPFLLCGTVLVLFLEMME